MLDDARQHDLVRRLWVDGPLSRTELHRRLNMTPNGVGVLAEALLQKGIVRECQSVPSRGGRPRVPLDIDPSARHVVGLSLAPGRVNVGRFGLRGQLLGSPTTEQVDRPENLIDTACKLLRNSLNRQTLAVGVSVPGFVDSRSHEILFSSATPGLGRRSLKPLYKQAKELPVLVENDVHAATARWMLTHRSSEDQDVLLVGFEDGELGATMLIGGRANRGCVYSANELGHSRFVVPTERCYCGHTGCLERICSSDFLNRQPGAAAGSRLADRARQFDGADSALEEMIRYLALGIANATNFVRPHQLVLASHLMRFPAFTELLIRTIRGLLLVELADRVRLNLWDQPVSSSAETAAWLALAGLYSSHWNSTHAKSLN